MSAIAPSIATSPRRCFVGSRLAISGSLDRNRHKLRARQTIAASNSTALGEKDVVLQMHVEVQLLFKLLQFLIHGLKSCAGVFAWLITVACDADLSDQLPDSSVFLHNRINRIPRGLEESWLDITFIGQEWRISVAAAIH
jgi:hypothetical protein